MSTPTVGHTMPLDLLAPHQKYYLASGEEVPGVTAILKSTSDEESSENLYRWFNSRGLEGDKYPCKDKVGADLGKVIHGRIEAFLRGYEGLDPAGIPEDIWFKSMAPYERFLDRWMSRGLQVVESECQLVSEELRYGGTIDIVAHEPGRGLGLIDVKSSKPYVRWEGKKRWTDLDFDHGHPVAAPYKKVKLQVGGYHRLWSEKRPGYPIMWVEVMRVGKEETDPGQTHDMLPSLKSAMNAFEKAVEFFYAQRNL